MKKTFSAIAAVMLIAFITGSAFIVLQTHPTYQVPANSDSDSQVMNAESIENSGQLKESEGTNMSNNQNCNVNDAEEGQNLGLATSDEPNEGQVETSQNNNGCTDSCPPDGHVYSSPEPPYAYTPTCMPKGWPKLPIAPPESED